MVQQYAFGFDYGNAESCGMLVNQGIKHSKTVPSSIALGSFSNLIEKREALGDTYEQGSDALRSHEYVIEISGSEFFVGELALNESRGASTGRGDISRYWSPKSLAMLLVISKELVQSSEYELHVVTGLPVETFNKENRANVKKALEGEHVFTLNGKRCKALIHVDRVVMESAGAMIAYGKSEDVLQGVIDIGGRTTDLYVAEKQRTIVEMCKGKPVGVESVIDIVNARFTAKYKRSLKASESRKLLRAYLGETYPTLQASGNKVDTVILHEWMETAINEVSQDILSFVSTAWNTSERGAVAADISPVLIIGGGAYYFADKIKNRIPHAIVPVKPETANAEGYATLAHMIMIQVRNRSMTQVAHGER